MKLNNYSLLLCSLATSALLASCNSGSSNTSPNKISNNVATTQKTQGVGYGVINIESINKMYNSTSESQNINTASQHGILVALITDPTKVSLRDLTNRLLITYSMGAVGFTQQFLLDAIFGSPTDQATVYYQNIMNKLDLMDKKLDNLLILSNMTYTQLISSQYKADNNSIQKQYDYIIKQNSLLKDFLNQFHKNTNATSDDRTIGNVGNLFLGGQIDFTDATGKTLNPDLFQLVDYISQHQHLYKIALTNTFGAEASGNMDNVLVNLSNMLDADAYNFSSATASNSLMSFITSNGGGVDEQPNLIPDLANSITLVIKNNYSTAFYNTSSTTVSYQYNDLNNNYAIHHEYNKLPADLEIDTALGNLRFQLINKLNQIQRYQMIAIAFRVLGLIDNDTVSMPVTLETRYSSQIIAISDTKQQIIKDYKNKKITFNEAKARLKTQVSEPQKALFFQIVNDLKASYANRAKNIVQLTDISTVTSGDNQLGFKANLIDNVALPTWDFFHGTGVYAQQNNPIHVEPIPADILNDDAKLSDYISKYGTQPRYNVGGTIYALSDLISGDSAKVYWDGYYLKTFNSAGGIVFQHINPMCNVDSNGVYSLQLLNSNLLYCSNDTFNYNDLSSNFNGSRARQQSYIQLPQIGGASFNTNVNNGIQCTSSSNLIIGPQYRYPTSDDQWQYGWYSKEKDDYALPDYLSNGTSSIADYSHNLYIDFGYLRNQLNSDSEKCYIPVASSLGLTFLVLEPGSSDSYISMATLQSDWYFQGYKFHETGNGDYSDWAIQSNLGSNNVFAVSKSGKSGNSGWARYFTAGVFSGYKLTTFDDADHSGTRLYPGYASD